MSLYQERSCRVCAGELETILDLGALYPSDFLRPDAAPAAKVPHDLCVCIQCRLVQLRHTLEPDQMFRQYWYLSGVNETMRDELADVVAGIKARVTLTEDDTVVDIGANDGTLLAAYALDVLKIAFEPAYNLQPALRRHADVAVTDYFPQGLDQIPGGLDGRVKAVTAIACFYDLDDPLSFLAAVKRVLHPDGVAVVQFQDWHQMQARTAFDNICTEHLFYPTMAAVERMAAQTGLRVVDAERRAINGGSLRLYLQHEWHPSTEAVETIGAWELTAESWETISQFGWRCEQVKRQIQGALAGELACAHTIDVYGASTKFNTLAQWCGVDHTRVRQAWERSPAKFGLVTSGTRIPIVNEVDGRLDPPDALLVGIWQFRDAILRREESYLNLGGTLIFPLPVVDVVRAYD